MASPDPSPNTAGASSPPAWELSAPAARAEPLSGSAAAPQPRRVVVSRAEALIHARPDAAVNACELARALGVSVRSLFRAFQTTRGYGPGEARLRARLRHVQSELLAGRPGATVTEIAQSWGFVHLGRFAAAYRRHFGERPSDTLRARTTSIS